jgi:2-amino-4-deoxychorismate synthase
MDASDPTGSTTGDPTGSTTGSTTGDPTGARDALETMLGHEAWAAIRLRDAGTVTLVGGSRSEVERLLDVPLEDGAPEPGRRFDRLVAIPFRQVAERGFEAHDDGTPLTVVDIETEAEVPLRELLAALPDEAIEFADRGGFDTSDEE